MYKKLGIVVERVTQKGKNLLKITAVYGLADYALPREYLQNDKGCVFVKGEKIYHLRPDTFHTDGQCTSNRFNSVWVHQVGHVITPQRYEKICKDIDRCGEVLHQINQAKRKGDWHGEIVFEV